MYYCLKNKTSLYDSEKDNKNGKIDGSYGKEKKRK